MNILHLSDLHFGTLSDAKLWYSQLADDLVDELSCKKIDILIISGDVSNKAIASEFKAAKFFFDKLCKEFEIDLTKMVIVPGNHDLCWDISKKAYKPMDGADRIDHEKAPHVQNDKLHRERFSPFSQFYYNIKGEYYPLDYEYQGIIHYLKDFKILIIGLNSSWELDDHFTSRASIYPNAISNIMDSIRKSGKYSDWLKIAVWNHPLNGPFEDRIKDHGFMERLAQKGFKLCLHGHLHKSTIETFRYDQSPNGRKIEVVGAGTFGALTKEWYDGYPLQYNLLKVSDNKIIVHTRRREEINGAWKPDARWLNGPHGTPLPHYNIELSSKEIANFDSGPPAIKPIDNLVKPSQILLKNAKHRWNFPDVEFPLSFKELPPDRIRKKPDLKQIKQDDLINKICDGGNHFSIYSDKAISEADCLEFSEHLKRIGNSVAKKLKTQAEMDEPFRDKLLIVLESKPEALYESFVCQATPPLTGPKEIAIVLRYLDESIYPTGGQSSSKTIKSQFWREVPRGTYSGVYKSIHQANTALRKQLFYIASQPGPSRNRANSILLALEDARIHSGRPVDETRHPDIESGTPWPNRFNVSDTNMESLQVQQ